MDLQKAANLLHASPPILLATSSENKGSSLEVLESKKGLKSSKVSSLMFNLLPFNFSCHSLMVSKNDPYELLAI